MDLYFIFDMVFILMVDECLRYAVSARLKSKSAEDLLRAVFYSWTAWGHTKPERVVCVVISVLAQNLF